eukprot:3561063-Rhodomonas_salina.1
MAAPAPIITARAQEALNSWLSKILIGTQEEIDSCRHGRRAVESSPDGRQEMAGRPLPVDL